MRGGGGGGGGGGGRGVGKAGLGCSRVSTIPWFRPSRWPWVFRLFVDFQAVWVSFGVPARRLGFR